MSIRQAIIDEIELLSSPSKQLEYEKNVPIANVPAELICGFCDDLYVPESEQILSEFSPEELNGLAHLYRLLVDASKIDIGSVSELLKLSEWRRVVSLAKDLNSHYAKINA